MPLKGGRRLMYIKLSMPLVKMLRPFMNLLSLIVAPVPSLFQRICLDFYQRGSARGQHSISELSETSKDMEWWNGTMFPPVASPSVDCCQLISHDVPCYLGLLKPCICTVFFLLVRSSLLSGSVLWKLTFLCLPLHIKLTGSASCFCVLRNNLYRFCELFWPPNCTA